MSKLAKIKTTATDESVAVFINSIIDEQKRADAFSLIQLMKAASNEEPKLWVSGIIAFGELRYKSPATGREVDWFKIGFSPRKTNFSIYLNLDLQKHMSMIQQLGKIKTGAGCIYFKRMSDIDKNVLHQLLVAAINEKR
jgi:hypothetical protein